MGTIHYILNITHLIIKYGYEGVFIIVFLESSFFFPLPGDSLLFTVGILASNNTLSIITVIPLIFIATFLGAILGYWIGINIEKLHRYSIFRKILNKEHTIKAHKFFEKYGMWAIIFSRFVPIVRTFAPIAAGIAKMNYYLFLRYSFIGSILWSFIIILAGYFLGHSFPGIINYLPIFVGIVILLSILPIFFKLFQKKT